MLRLLSCFLEHTLGNSAGLFFGVLQHTLRFFVGSFRLFKFFCCLLAIVLSCVHVALYGTLLDFHIILALGEIALPVLLLGVAVEVE